MQRIARRPARLAALAAVPVLLIAGCSSGSDSGSGTAQDAKESAGAASAPPKLAAAKYSTIPDPCKALSKGTAEDLVPEAEKAAGKASKSSDTSSRGTCSWNGLDGYQYRWLDVTYQRFESVEGIGSAEEQAKERFASQLKQSAGEAKDAARKDLKDLGDQAVRLSWKAKDDGEEYRRATVVARTANVVVIVNYNGAGFEDGKTPKAKTVEDGAAKAAGEAVAAVDKAAKK